MMRLRPSLLGLALLVALSGSCSKQPEQLENAKVLIDLGKPEKAIELVDQVIAADASNVDAHLLRGRALLVAGDLEAAEEAFSDAIALGGTSAAEAVDAQILETTRVAFESVFVGSGRKDMDEKLRPVIEGFDLLVTDDGKRAIVSWAAGFFLDLARSEGQEFRENYFRWVFDELGRDRLQLDDRFIESQAAPAIEALLKIAEETPERERGKQAAAALALAADVFGRESDRFEATRARAESLRTDAERAVQTLADMRSIGTAIESHFVDHGEYPTVQDIRDLASRLSPTYIRRIPVTDGWGQEYGIQSIHHTYSLVSSGADRAFDRDWGMMELEPDSTDNLARDIVYHEGRFVRYPAPQLVPDWRPY